MDTRHTLATMAVLMSQEEGGKTNGGLGRRGKTIGSGLGRRGKTIGSGLGRRDKTIGSGLGRREIDQWGKTGEVRVEPTWRERRPWKLVRCGSITKRPGNTGGAALPIRTPVVSAVWC